MTPKRIFLRQLDNGASATVFFSSRYHSCLAGASLSHKLSKVLFVYFIVLGYKFPSYHYSQDHTWYNSQTYWKGIETVLVCKLVCSNAKGIIRWFKKKNLYCWLLSHGYFTNQSYFVEQLIQSRHECPNQQCKFASQISSGLNST